MTETIRQAIESYLERHWLLKLCQISQPPVPERVITDLPHVQVTRLLRLPGAASGLTHWAKGMWEIAINASESPLRQRFSLAHDFKHVLDDPFITQLYGSPDSRRVHEWVEDVCDYFAACLLMPRAWVKAAYYRHGGQDVRQLAQRFAVSPKAMGMRLMSIVLVEPWTVRHGVYRREVTGVGA